MVENKKIIKTSENSESIDKVLDFSYLVNRQILVCLNSLNESNQNSMSSIETLGFLMVHKIDGKYSQDMEEIKRIYDQEMKKFNALKVSQKIKSKKVFSLNWWYGIEKFKTLMDLCGRIGLQGRNYSSGYD